MAILKYKNNDGGWISVNSYKVNNVIVSQEIGQSTTDVMSQKAVTDEINNINITIEDKANAIDVYTKTEIDNKVIDAGEY